MSHADKDSSIHGDLSARRMRQMADENHQLREYVAEIMTRLNENERLFMRLFDLESTILKADDPENMCFVLLRGLRSGFDLDMVRLWFDRDGMMGSCAMDAISERDLVWVESGEIEQMGLATQTVWLMTLTPEEGFDWLEPRDQHLNSLALLILGDLARPFGVLGMGSVEKERFHPGHGTDFLQHLSRITGLSLEHAISRERLARISMSDTVTGMRNQRFLQPHSNQALAQWFGRDVAVACLYLDVDGLAQVNHAVNHEAGNELLAAVAAEIRQLIRAQDPVIRMDDDEFTVLLAGCTSEKACLLAEKMVEACSQIQIAEQTVRVSIGVVYAAPEKNIRVKELISAADHAMYIAKALGGGRFEKSDMD